jgi:hypothetical protein
MISTRNLDALPDITGLTRTLQGMAMLDAILSPEWQYRYYSFNTRWAPGERMGSMRNGHGDDFFAHLSGSGCWLKGFAHEYPMNPHRHSPKRVWPGVLDSVPKDFANCLTEPAFSLDETTFCIWRRSSDDRWQRGPVQFPEGPDPDGSAFLLSDLDGRPATYQNFAQDYYERDVDIGAVEHIYAHRVLTDQLVARLNPDLTLADIAADIEEIGYPVREQRPMSNRAHS